MNRVDRLREVLRLEGLAAAATELAQVHRNELSADARAELAREGAAPTWRIPDLAVITLGVSKATPYITNEVALLEWVQVRYPDQVETVERVRPGFRGQLLDDGIIDGSEVVDATTGEVMRGVAVRPGGLPGSLTIRATHDARVLFEAIGERTLDELLAPDPDPEDHR